MFNISRAEIERLLRTQHAAPVSYTPLTLSTICSVYITVGAAFCKKKSTQKKIFTDQQYEEFETEQIHTPHATKRKY